MYVKLFLFDIQENVMDEIVCSENVEKLDLKLVVEVKVLQYLEFVFVEEVQIKKFIYKLKVLLIYIKLYVNEIFMYYLFLIYI